MGKKTSQKKFQRMVLQKDKKVNSSRKAKGDRRVRIISSEGKVSSLYLHPKTDRGAKVGSGDINIKSTTCPVSFKAEGGGKYLVSPKALKSGELSKNTPVLVDAFGPAPWTFRFILQEEYIPYSD